MTLRGDLANTSRTAGTFHFFSIIISSFWMKVDKDDQGQWSAEGLCSSSCFYLLLQCSRVCSHAVQWHIRPFIHKRCRLSVERKTLQAKGCCRAKKIPRFFCQYSIRHEHFILISCLLTFILLMCAWGGWRRRMPPCECRAAFRLLKGDMQNNAGFQQRRAQECFIKMCKKCIISNRRIVETNKLTLATFIFNCILFVSPMIKDKWFPRKWHPG